MQINDCKRVRKLHFVGIGGAGMSGIAEVLHDNGFVVSGSDTGESPVIEYLKGLGITIAPKHEAKNVENADLVVYSSAVPHDNPELVEARNRRIPVIRRAEMLGELMRLKYTLSIAGTHGKTTTTSIVGQIWEEAGLDPTIIVGGVVKGKGSGAKVGRGDYLIAESDEFDRSFLSMMPSSAIVTNIDADHLDTYENIEDIKDAFVQFVNKIPFYGQAILCLDDPNVQAILSRVRKPVITYGFRTCLTRLPPWRSRTRKAFLPISRARHALNSRALPADLNSWARRRALWCSTTTRTTRRKRPQPFSGSARHSRTSVSWWPSSRTCSAVPATSTRPSVWRSRTATCSLLPTFTPHVNARSRALPARSLQTARVTVATAMHALWATR